MFSVERLLYLLFFTVHVVYQKVFFVLKEVCLPCPLSFGRKSLAMLCKMKEPCLSLTGTVRPFQYS